MTELAPIFVNNERVRVQGDPSPKVSKIIVNCGKEPGQVEVFRLTSQQDMYGKRLSSDEFIDRAAEVNPVYLRLLERQGGGGSQAESVGGPPGRVPETGAEKPREPPTATPPSPPGAGRPQPAPTRRPTPGQPKTSERQNEPHREAKETAEGETGTEETEEEPKES